MKRILLSLLLTMTVVSCSDSSSSTPAPAPGQDGDKQVALKDIVFDGRNEDFFDIPEKGKDLLLAVAFPLGPKLKGQLVIEELKTDIENKIAQVPKPIDDQTQKVIDKFCFPSNTRHQWVLRRLGVDTPMISGQKANFEFGTVLYLVVETKSAPKCEHFYYSFSTKLTDAAYKPDPTPTPPPPPPPAIPAGSESVVLIDPEDRANFSIEYDKKEGRNFTYRVSMLVDGPAFARTEEVEKIFVNIFDKTTDSYVSDWTEILTNSPASLLGSKHRLEFTLDKFSAPTFFIDRQKDMVLVFAINSPTDSKLAPRSLELDKYCAQSSHSFVHARTGVTGCP